MTTKGEWQVQQAKSGLSELLARARDSGPQAITRHGERVAVVLGVKEFERLTAAPKTSLLEFLTAAPLGERQIPARDREDFGRELEL